MQPNKDKTRQRLRDVRVLRLPHYMTFVTAIWLFVVLLYGLRWSSYFSEPLANLLPIVGAIIVGALVGFKLLGGRIGHAARDRIRLSDALSVGNRLTTGYRFAFAVWLALAAIEIASQGAPPLLRAAMGQHSEYLHYGLASIHGLLLAFACVLALIEQVVRLNRGLIPLGPYTLAILFWLLLVIGRKHLIVIALQLVLLLLARGVIKISVLNAAKWTALGTGAVFAFGFLGDLRSVAGVGIKEKLMYTGPNWMPDAVVWLYSYVSTPLANLQNAYVRGFGGDDILSSGALSGLLPSIFRATGQDLEGADEFATYPWLLTSNFNVSTGYIVPLIEANLNGIFFFAVGAGLFSAILLGATRGLGTSLAYLVSVQCSVMMIFGNNFANLNTISQIPLLLLLASRLVSNSNTDLMPLRIARKNMVNAHVHS